jgi:predicted phosphodiesterase
MDWKLKAEQLKFDENKTWHEMAEIIQSEYFQNENVLAVHDKVRNYIRKTDRYKSKRKNNADRPIGVFSDTHIPFDHPNYLQFVKDTFKKYKVGQVICTGDLVDNHAISRFQSEPSALGAYDELDRALLRVKEYVKAFPKVKLCKGNHDEIPTRQAATIGLGSRYLKSFSELLELPKTWQVEDEYIINDVLYKHGLNCMGKDGALNTAINERISTVIGHSHSFGGCKYSANKRDIIFGMNVGCGIDIEAYAFAYGKHAKYRPTLGCGIVFDSDSAIFVPMGKEYFRGNKEE